MMTRSISTLIKAGAIALGLTLANAPVHALTITNGFTGSWYNPATEGQGFNIQVLSGANGPQVLAYWYTFDTAGNPKWVIGIGDVQGNTVTMKMVSPSGPTFGPGFNSADVQLTDFANVTMSFDSCGSGQVQWTGLQAGVNNGSMALQQLSQNISGVCTGGVSDNRSMDMGVVEFRAYLENTDAFPDGEGHADYEERPDRTEFTVEIEDVPAGSYDLVIGGDSRGSIEVIADGSDLNGEIEFRSPVDDDDQTLLDFDPLGQTIEIFMGDALAFSGIVEPSDPPSDDDDGDNDDGDDDGSGSEEIELHLTNTGVTPDASGEAEYNIHSDHTEFTVEVEDLDEGTYQLVVGGVQRGEIEVVMTPDGTEGKLEFRDPVEDGNLLLDFDPRGETISVEQAGDPAVVFLEGLFPTEATDDDDGDGDDGSGDGDDNGDGDDGSGDDDDGDGDDGSGDDDDDDDDGDDDDDDDGDDDDDDDDDDDGDNG